MARILAVCVALLGLLFVALHAHARDLGQWENADPVIRGWMASLKQPDNPAISCCGEADAYWCDDVSVEGDRVFCKVTDDRPDEPLRRPHIAIGTKFEIPRNKYKWDKGNPTGHNVLFVSVSGIVWCFVQGGGV